MSTTSNDPFDNPNANQGQAQPTYGQEDFAQNPPKKSRKGLWIGCGIVGLLGPLLCCGGIVILGYFSFDAMGDMIRSEVATSPTVIEHFGEIESMSMNFASSAEEAQNIQPGQGTPLVFDVQGSKGSGQIVIQQSRGGQGVESAILITSTGERLPVQLANGPASELDDTALELQELESSDLFGTE